MILDFLLVFLMASRVDVFRVVSPVSLGIAFNGLFQL